MRNPEKQRLGTILESSVKNSRAFDRFPQRKQALHREHWVSLLVGFLVVCMPSPLDAVALSIRQPNRELQNQISEIGMSRSSIFRGEAVGQPSQSDPIYRGKRVKFGFTSGDMLLRVQSESKSKPTAEQTAEDGYSDRKQQVIQALYYIRLQFIKHWWITPLGVCISTFIGFMFGFMPARLHDKPERSLNVKR
jgi:hypothetical protein